MSGFRNTLKTKSSAILVVQFLFLFILSCSEDFSELVEMDDKKSTIAIVNDEKIDKSRLLDELKSLKQKYRVESYEVLPDKKLSWLKNEALNQIVRKMLLKQEAKKQGLLVSAEELDQYLTQLKQGYTSEAFKETFESSEINEEKWKDEIKDRLLLNKLIKVVVSSKVSVDDKELQGYFNMHTEEFHRKRQVRALHIMVKTEDEAWVLLKKIKSGEKFRDLARAHSLSLEGKNGGDLGFLEDDKIIEEFDILFSLEINKVSEIIHSPYGYHIFKIVDKKKDRKMSFGEAKEIIHAKLLAERQELAFSNWLIEVKEKANIDLDYEALDNVT